MGLHFIKGKDSNFVLEMVGFGWKNKGQTNMDTKSDERLWKGTPKKKV